MNRVKRSKTGQKVKHLGITLDAHLVDQLKDLAQDNGVSTNFIIQRLVTVAVLQKKIPWPNELALERAEREKWGESAVPVYDPNVEASPTRAEDAQ